MLALVVSNGVAFAGPLEDLSAAYELGARRQLMKWLAEKGNAAAQYNVGVQYEKGQGVAKDYREAIKWYRLAAAQGHADAEANLGWMYGNGLGVPQSWDEAVKWYRLAAAQGDRAAQMSLGAMYASGHGVPQDYVLSYMWLTIAKAPPAAKDFQTIAPKMTPARVELAQKMARRCTASNYKQCGETQGNQESSTPVTSVPMRIEGGTYVVPVLINDAIHWTSSWIAVQPM